MNQKEIIAMAKEASICHSADSYEFTHDGMLGFAALVGAKEREACALVCDRMAQDAALSNRRRCDADALARSIRSRGQKEGV